MPGNRKLKLDLHTHCYEATGFVPPSLEIVESILANLKSRGLDGIAITEHGRKDYGLKVKEIVEQHFDSEVMIIPGCELYMPRGQQVVELYLPDGSTFRFWAHPLFHGQYREDIGLVQGVEIENWMHEGLIDREKARAMAQEDDLLLLTNSDAHDLKHIGEYYNEIELEELCARARRTSLGK